MKLTLLCLSRRKNVRDRKSVSLGFLCGLHEVCNHIMAQSNLHDSGAPVTWSTEPHMYALLTLLLCDDVVTIFANYKFK